MDNSAYEGTSKRSSVSSATVSGGDGGLSKADMAAALAITPGVGGRDGGMGYLKASYFLIATMIGAGFLALPRALADAGWLGIPMLVICGSSVGFVATRLGKSWIILEERWPQYRLPARQPYMDLAEKAFGSLGRKICFVCVISTLIGYGISFFVLISDMMNAMVPDLSMCAWIVIVTLLLWPATFFGTPKDFWQASVLAVVATAVTIVVILVQLFIDIPKHPDPQHPNPTVSSFALGFSGILFAFGGVSVFPTLQNDMEHRREWWKTVVIGFSVVLCLYLPIAISGYVIIGDEVTSNILMDATPGTAINIAVSLDIVNLLGTYVICFNPVGQAFEDILGIDNKFSWKRVCVRTSIVFFEFLIAMAVPDFGAILNLFGGSTITILSFVFPPLMYIWLVDMKGDWPQIEIALWERIYLWMIVGVAVVGGVISTISAVIVIVDPDSIGESCLANFQLSHYT